MDLVFNFHGSITYLDVSVVSPFSCSPSLVSAASTKPGLMAKRAEKAKFDRYPHVNLVPFILETTGRPGPHARKFINYLLRDADNPNCCETLGPPSKVSSTVPSPNNNLRLPSRDSWGLLSHSVCVVCTVLMGASTRPGTQTTFSVSSLLQPCHVALL